MEESLEKTEIKDSNFQDALLRKALSEVNDSTAENKDAVNASEVMNSDSHEYSASRKKRVSGGTPGKTRKKRKKKNTKLSKKEQ